MFNSRPLRRRRNDEGITLLEVMIVIAIIGLLSALAIPDMSAWISRMRLNSATTRITSQLRLTKKMALTKRARYCMTFAGDVSYTNGNTSNYSIVVSILEETAPNAGVWQTVTQPPELAGFTNNSSTELWRGISLEDPATSGDSTLLTGAAGCAGLLFNNSGYLDNLGPDFTPCNGGNCAKMTLRNKSKAVGAPQEQRTIWVNRGGEPRVTSGPGVLPPL